MEDPNQQQVNDHSTNNLTALKPKSRTTDVPTPIKTEQVANDGIDSGYASQTLTPDLLRNGQGDIPLPAVKPQPRILYQNIKTTVFDIDAPMCVQRRFRDLKMFINGPLYRHLFQDGTSPSPISITLGYMGKDLENAKPILFVMCQRKIAKKVRSFFKQAHIKEQCRSNGMDPEQPSFQVFVYEKAPQELAGADSIQYWMSSPASAGLGDPLCGALVHVRIAGQERYSTIGGILEISGAFGSQIYAITVSHVTQNLKDPNDYRADPFSKREDPVIRTSAHSMMLSLDRWIEQSDGDDDDDRDSIFADDFELSLDDEMSGFLDDEVEPSVEGDVDFVAPYLVGRVANSAFITGVRTDLRESKLDWVLIKLPKRVEYLSSAKKQAMILKPPTNDGCSAGLGARVVVFAGKSGEKHGHLANRSALYTVGSAGGFVETYVLKLDQHHVLSPGDCGSWVVDRYTWEVYGQVVAGDVLRNFYVVPLGAIFKEIKEKLGDVSITFLQPPKIGHKDDDSRTIDDDHCIDSGYASYDTSTLTSPV